MRFNWSLWSWRAVIAREHQHPITKSRKEQRGASINWGEILERLTTGGRKLNEAEVGIKGTLELILEWLNAIARRSTPVPNLNSDETERSVCKVDCKCNICIGIDATSLRRSAGGCLHSIDCVCNIRIGSDTSLGGEGLNCDETEIIWPHDFHILDDPQIHQSRKMTISKNSIKRSRTIKKEIED